LCPLSLATKLNFNISKVVYWLFVQGGLLLVRSLEEIGRKLLIFTLLMATLALIKLYVVQEYTLC